jgi:hypothetical protein
MSPVSWKAARGRGGSVRGRAPAMSSTHSDVGTRVARTRFGSAITADALRVTLIDAKRSSAVVVGTPSDGCK